MRRLATSLCALAAGLLAIAVAGAPRAGAAEAYGELSRFGGAGIGPGQFTFTRETHAFGVDPTDNSVYVGDEPRPGVYRIQKLTSSGTFIAQTATFAPPHPFGLEGIAVDPALERVYVLALERRSLPELELTIAVAGTLYAFSTKPAGETLPAASGTKEGVLTTPAVFLSHASPASRALGEPRGLAVDPTTHEVIAMGEVETEEPESNPVALQRVSASSGKLGARYTTSALPEHETATSPAVSSTGKVYIEQYDRLLQVPSDFASTEAPVRVGGVREEAELEGEKVQLLFPDPPELQGGGLSFAPVGPRGEPEGALVAAAGVFDEGAYYPGFAAFDAATGAEVGWSGGGTRRIGETCTIGFQGPANSMLAAGGGGDVFVLDPHYAEVIEFGPGGGGCPAAHDGELKALVGGSPLSGEVDEGAEVTLESNLVQAGAVSVEWSFGEEEAEPLVLAGDYRQHTEVVHTFTRGGEHVVTEVIHTDDLATPTLEAKVVVSVRTGKQPPTAVISGPISVDAGEEAAFDGSASWDPNGRLGTTAIARYEWSFGDGGTAVTEAPEVQHVYAAPGIYTASLVVEDALGLRSEASSISVTVQAPAPPPLAPEPPLGGGIAGAGAEAATSPAAPAPSPSPHGGGHASTPVLARLAGGVLAASARGSVNAALNCPAAAGRCEGTLSLRTLRRFRARRGGRERVQAITLASASFSIAAGRQRSLTLRLSRLARALLARNRSLEVRATVTAQGGAKSVTDAVVELSKPTSGRESVVGRRPAKGDEHAMGSEPVKKWGRKGRQ